MNTMPRVPDTLQKLPRPRRQHGAVLVVALIFLLLLTILAVAASGSSMLQLRMAGNLRNAQQARMSANTALRGAEWKLWTSASRVGGHMVCTDGGVSNEGCIRYNPANTAAYGPEGTVTAFRHDHGWLDGAGKAYKGAKNTMDYTSSSLKTAKLAHNPVYLIEDMGRVLPPNAGPQHESGATGPQNIGPGHLDMHVYRITARATGGSENAVRVLQSTFDAQTNN